MSSCISTNAAPMKRAFASSFKTWGRGQRIRRCRYRRRRASWSTMSTLYDLLVSQGVKQLKLNTRHVDIR